MFAQTTISKSTAIQDGTTASQKAAVSAGGAIKVDNSGVTQPISGTVTTTPPSNASTNVAQVGGTATDTNSGNKSAGTQRVVIATDQPSNTNALKVDGSGVTQPVSGTFWQATQPVSGTFWQATQPVSGTFWQATQPISGTVTSNEAPVTSGGLTTFHLVSAATTNATNIKASAGQVYGWYIYNSNAAARKVAFHNSASSPTAGASIFFTLVIPPNGGTNVSFGSGIPFSSGIGITTVTGLADSDATAVALNDLIINIFYK